MKYSPTIQTCDVCDEPTGRCEEDEIVCEICLKILCEDCVFPRDECNVTYCEECFRGSVG